LAGEITVDLRTLRRITITEESQRGRAMLRVINYFC